MHAMIDCMESTRRPESTTERAGPNVTSGFLTGRTVMVTGGAGFIGSHVVDRLAVSGVREIVVVDNLFLGKESNLDQSRAAGAPVVFRCDDAADTGRVRELVVEHGVSVVFEMATIPLPASLEHPHWSSQTVYNLALTAGELAREGTIERLVHCSSSEVYGSAVYSPMDEDHPLAAHTPYAAAKAAGDLLLQSYMRTFGISCAIVRPFNTYGPRQNDGSYAGIIPLTLRRIREGKPPMIFGDGNQTRDFTFVEDVAALVVALADRTDLVQDPVNVASGQELRIRDLVAVLCRTLAYEGDWVWHDERPGDVRRHVAGTRRLERLIGRHDFVGLDAGVARTVEWYLQSGQDAPPPE